MLCDLDTPQVITLALSFIWGISFIWQFSRSFSSIVLEYSRCKFWWFSCRNKSLSTSSLLFRINSSRSHSHFGYISWLVFWDTKVSVTESIGPWQKVHGPSKKYTALVESILIYNGSQTTKIETIRSFRGKIFLQDRILYLSVYNWWIKCYFYIMGGKRVTNITLNLGVSELVP